MKVSRKNVVLLMLVLTLFSGIAAVTPGKNGYKNLKVLPKDISQGELSRIMIDEFEDGLGVSCGFCHIEERGSHRLDYASDVRPEKSIARRMMKMTLNINKKYFKIKDARIGKPVLAVSCMTCHNGRPRPEAAQ